jgi:hypothetical protein
VQWQITLFSRHRSQEAAQVIRSPRRPSPGKAIEPQGSNLDSVRKQRIAPFIERSHEIGLGVDRLPFASKPFAAIGFKRKMLDE